MAASMPECALLRVQGQARTSGHRVGAQPAVGEDVDALARDEELRALAALLDEARRGGDAARSRVVHPVPQLEALEATLAERPVRHRRGGRRDPAAPAV